MTTIVSANIGSYDSPKVHAEQSVPCEFVYIDRRDADVRHPRMAAKAPKLRPWRCTTDRVGPWIWIDASFQIVSPTFVEEVVAGADGNLIAQWEHPDRACCFAEAEFSAPLPKYRGVPVLEQAAHYRQSGHPTRWGLWATGLIVYREPVDYLADLWWAEMNRWGYQDQVSQPVALRAAGMRPAALPYGLRANPWLAHIPHADGTI